MLDLIKAYGPRLAYSAILLALVIILLREVVQVWGDRRIYMGQFEYLVDEPAAGAGATFAAKVQNQQRVLAAMLAEERDRREAERARQERLKDTDIGNNLPPVPDLLPNAKSALEGLELKVQGFDIGALAAKLRGWISPRNEVTGVVEKEGESIVPSVTWPLKLTDGTSQFYRGAPEPTDTDAAYQLAAAIVWAQAVSARKTGEPPFASRADFVAWARAWRLYRQARGAIAIGGDPAEQAPTIKRAVAILDNPQARKDVYPEILRLYTDLAALAAPAGARVSAADTAALADRYVQQAVAQAPESAPAPVNVVPAGTARTAAPAAAAQPVVRPGVLLWDAEGRSAVTVGAIVLDAEGARYAVIPAYMLDVTARDELTLLLGRGGPPVAVARRADVQRMAGDTFGGVVLARLNTGVEGRNELEGGRRITAYGPPPKAGAALTVATTRGPERVTVSQVDPALIRVSAVTQPGDGGAPVLDAQGRLVAFAYVKGGFLPVASVAGRYPLADGVKPTRRRTAAE